MELDPRIRIRAPLRCDGIGRLDWAEDADSGARLAVRWLPLEANGDAAVKACAQLPAHPMLPRIRQTGQVGASAFVALDFPDGQLLSAREGERLDNEVLVRLAGQVADALATVHGQDVVHGELSADSVLLTKDKAYLWDMPLVIANRLADRRGENRLMQNLVKTAAFLSPERARGEAATRAGDVYGLGVVLCVAAGAPLPSGATTLGLVHQVATGQWVPRVPAQLPDAWREVIAGMLASEPSARPSADEVARAFADVPSHTALPTVPEFPAVKLPAELLAVAASLGAARADEEAMRAKTREMPLVQLPAPQAPASAVATSTLQLEAPAVATVVRGELDDVPEADAEVVRIPTVELRAVTLPADAVPAAPVAAAPSVALTDAVSVAPELAAASVALTDSVSVAPELAAASVTLSANEVEAIHRGRAQVGMLVAGFALAALGLLMVALVLFLRTSDAPAPVAAPAPVVVVPAPVVVPAAVEADDELAPLLKLAPVKKAPRAVAPKAAAAPVRPAPAPVTMTETATPSATPPQADDFGFLEGAPAPKTELKRPEL